MTWVSSRVSTQVGKAGIVGKAERTIFRNWAGIAGKSYTFSHRRLKSWANIFIIEDFITTAVVNVGVWNFFWFSKMAFKQNFWRTVLVLLASEKPRNLKKCRFNGDAARYSDWRFLFHIYFRIFRNWQYLDGNSLANQSFCWACNFNPSIFFNLDWRCMFFNFAACFPTWEDFGRIQKDYQWEWSSFFW